MQKINIMGIRSSVILNRTGSDYLIMEELTKAEEDKMDAAAEFDQEVVYVKDGKIRIPSRDIFLYGQININDKNDIELIKNTQLCTSEVNMASNIPSRFDYETGYVYSEHNGIFKCHDTWNNLDWFKFNYCLIGKPDRIIIYRVNKTYVKRNRSTRCNINKLSSTNI